MKVVRIRIESERPFLMFSRRKVSIDPAKLPPILHVVIHKEWRGYGDIAYVNWLDLTRSAHFWGIQVDCN